MAQESQKTLQRRASLEAKEAKKAAAPAAQRAAAASKRRSELEAKFKAVAEEQTTLDKAQTQEKWAQQPADMRYQALKRYPCQPPPLHVLVHSTAASAMHPE